MRKRTPSMEFWPTFGGSRTYIHTPCNACNARNARFISGRNGCNGCNAQGRRNVHNRGSCGDRVRRVLTFVQIVMTLSWQTHSCRGRQRCWLLARTRGTCAGWCRPSSRLGASANGAQPPPAPALRSSPACSPPPHVGHPNLPLSSRAARCRCPSRWRALKGAELENAPRSPPTDFRGR